MKPTTLVTVLLVFATALSAKAAPLLNGLALEQQFNKDRFIAAVYSDTLATSAGTLLDNNTSRRLEVRILADSLSARSLRNQWMEGIAINNRGDVLSGQAENMVTFANLFSGRLKKGDQLSVAFAANSGTTSVALNGLPLGKIEDRGFFNTLLRAWIGPVPPSSDFREGLLAEGQVPSSLLGRYELLEPSQERIAQLTSQLEAREAKAEKAATAEQQVAAAKPAAAKPAAEKPAPIPDIPPPTVASAGGGAQAAATAAAKAAPQPSKPQATAKSRPPAPEEEELEEEEEEAPLTADIILARQLYHSMLLRHTFKNTSYPKRAQERGQEGSVRLNVVIDAGGRVKDIQTVQEARYSSLNRAAREAIERSSPYPKAPAQLTQSEYRFTVPITFRLPD
ncbi:TonB family protein [Microbulbifer sp.]|uniref:TonB family protein n=1 Tax=Microbulbifer sp. TaxID=1908541 RepID=UPI003F3A61AF